MVFKNRLKPKKEKSQEPFNTLSRDKLSATDFMSPGENHGVGVNQPVGSSKATMTPFVPQKTRQFTCEEALDY